MPGHGVSQSGRPAAHQGRCEPADDECPWPERRLPRDERHQEAARRQARAHRHQYGHRQEGDPRRGVPRRGRAGQEPDPADDVVVRQGGRGLQIRSGRRQEDAGRRGRPGRAGDRSLGDAGAAAVQSRRAPHCRVDAIRSRQGWHQGEDRQLRMGRVPQAHPEWRAHDGTVRMDRRQRRPGQLLQCARELCRGTSRRRWRYQMVQHGVR